MTLTSFHNLLFRITMKSTDLTQKLLSTSFPFLFQSKTLLPPRSSRKQYSCFQPLFSYLQQPKNSFLIPSKLTYFSTTSRNLSSCQAHSCNIHEVMSFQALLYLLLDALKDVYFRLSLTDISIDLIETLKENDNIWQSPNLHSTITLQQLLQHKQISRCIFYPQSTLTKEQVHVNPFSIVWHSFR